MPGQNGKTSEVESGAVLQYGGQAVIEGVMMRSPRYFAVACRKPNGEIVVQREEVDKSILGKLKWLNVPFLRGTLALIDAMALGSRALAFASHVQLEAEQEAQRNGQEAIAEGGTQPSHGHEASIGASATAASIINGPMIRIHQCDRKQPVRGWKKIAYDRAGTGRMSYHYRI